METSKVLAHVLGVANGSRASIGITEKHVKAMLDVAGRTGFAYVFGARSMSSRSALIVAFRDGDVLRLAFADVSRVAVAGSLANVLPGFPAGPLGDVAPGTKMSPRPDYAGVSIVALNLLPGAASLVASWMRAASPAFALPVAA